MNVIYTKYTRIYVTIDDYKIRSERIEINDGRVYYCSEKMNFTQVWREASINESFINAISI